MLGLLIGLSLGLVSFFPDEVIRPGPSHPTDVAYQKFAIGWIMTDYWSEKYTKLRPAHRAEFRRWMKAEVRDYRRRTTIIRQHLQKTYGRGMIISLDDCQNRALIVSRLTLDRGGELTTQRLIPDILEYEMKLSELLFLQYLCEYKAKRDGFQYDETLFVAYGQPMPARLQAALIRLTEEQLAKLGQTDHLTFELPRLPNQSPRSESRAAEPLTTRDILGPPSLKISSKIIAQIKD